MHKGKSEKSVALKDLSDSFIFDVSIPKKGVKMGHFGAFFLAPLSKHGHLSLVFGCASTS